MILPYTHALSLGTHEENQYPSILELYPTSLEHSLPGCLAAWLTKEIASETKRENLCGRPVDHPHLHMIDLQLNPDAASSKARREFVAALKLYVFPITQRCNRQYGALRRRPCPHVPCMASPTNVINVTRTDKPATVTSHDMCAPKPVFIVPPNSCVVILL